MEVRTPGPANLSQLRSTVSGLNLGDVGLQEFGARGCGADPPARAGRGAATQRAVAAVRGALETVAPAPASCASRRSATASRRSCSAAG
jgi:hypothetical protein